MSAFEELGVCPEIIQAIEEDGWLLPTGIQSEAIPYIINGKDVAAAAETGSGKTGAFGIPCLQIVHAARRNVAEIRVDRLEVGGGGNKMGLNISDKDPFILVSSDLREARCEDASRWSGIRCHVDVKDGEYMWEVEIVSCGMVRVGMSTSVGLLELGKDARGYGFGCTGKKSWNNVFTEYGVQYKTGDIIGVLISFPNRTISFAVNGQNFGPAYDIKPDQSLRPHICGKNFHVKVHYQDLKYPIQPYTPLANIQSIHSFTALTSKRNYTPGTDDRHPLCLILEPTRDLCIQTHSNIVKFAKYLESPDIRSICCVGGLNERQQKDSIQNGVDIVVGTIPKVTQWHSRGELDLSKLRFLVLDEADELLANDDKKFIPRIRNIAMSAQSNQQRSLQTLFFSATLHTPEVRRAVESLTKNPIWIDLKGRPTIPESVHAVVYRVDPTRALPFDPPGGIMPKTDGVHEGIRMTAPVFDSTDSGKTYPNLSQDEISERIKIMKCALAVKIADAIGMETCLIFCRTNLDCDNFEEYLRRLGGGKAFGGKVEGGLESRYSCCVLAGGRDQSERIRNLQHFKDGDIRFLVCTDVAARGIDISELPYLIMLTLPDKPELWFHRIGRVGRADNMGLAISICVARDDGRDEAPEEDETEWPEESPRPSAPNRGGPGGSGVWGVDGYGEKVWYHKCNKPKGLGCNNRNLLQNGGCCFYYFEESLLKGITDILRKRLPRMNYKTFNIPGILTIKSNIKTATAQVLEPPAERQRKAKRAKGITNVAGESESCSAGAHGILYGKQRNDKLMQQNLKRLEDLLPAAADLASLEAKLQTAYLCT